MIGKTISHYKILEKIGSGGMGIVYKAEDTKLNRNVALKFLPSEFNRNEEAKLRFINEAQTASKFDHVNICTIYDIIETDDDQLCIAMPSYEGETLKEKITNGRLEIDEAANITKQIAEGLKKAHENGIVHRDIKPANIFITKDGIVKILDFGLAKLSDKTQMTRMGDTIGTVSYMSPEQACGEKVDQRTDIWSLGVVLYEMLTGELPFKSDYEQAVIYSILNEDPNSIQSKLNIIPNELVQVVSRCLKKNPEERFQSTNEIIQTLQGENVESKFKRRIKSSGFWRIRNISIAAICVIVIAAIIFIYTSIVDGKVFDSIAVLPFENLSKDSTQIYFSQGLTNEIIERVWQVSSLRVPSLNTIKAKVKPGMTYAEIAKELGVKAVLNARIQKEGTHLKITASLMDPSSDRPLWYQSFEREYADILTLQSELAQAIVQNVRVTLTHSEKIQLSKAQQKVDPRAYEIYLKAKRELMTYASEADWKRLVGSLKQAIKIDSTYAPFYAILSSYYAMGCFDGFVSGLSEAEEAANKGLNLDPDNVESLSAKARVMWGLWRWKEAGDLFERALNLSPQNPFVLMRYSGYLLRLAKFEKAIDLKKKAFEIDPAIDWDHQEMIATYSYARRFDEAISEALKSIKESSGNVWVYNLLALDYAEKGMNKEALEALKKLFELGTPEESSGLMINTSAIYAFLNMKKEAEDILNKYLAARKGKDLNTAWVASAYACIGESEKAFIWLDRAYQERSTTLADLKIDHSWDRYRNDPRYIAMLKKIGLGE